MSNDVLRLLDLQTVAQLWNVSPHTIRAWVRQKRLNPTRICRRLLFDPDECARFLAEAKDRNQADAQ
jgi:DNA-binding transcriptional MerR regulator